MRGICVFVLISLILNQVPAWARAKHDIKPSWRFIEKRLRLNGFEPGFIEEMKQNYEIRDFQTVVDLNVLLFLREANDHAPQAQTKVAVEKTEAFMAENSQSLKDAESKYQVPGSVVASLLWIESRHGKNQGRYHVPSVFLSLIQADRPVILRHLRKEAVRFRHDPSIAQMKQIPVRARHKVEWALTELRAIEKAYNWKWTSVVNLRGSFSGAFGMPQFLPSSYARWARSETGKGAPDLFQAADAIHSVAYYLKDSGWKKQKPESQIDALLKYNNSRDYAEAILALSRNLQPRPNVDDERIAGPAE